MRIAVVCYMYGMFGSLTRDLLPILAENGHEVDLYTDLGCLATCPINFDHANIHCHIREEVIPAGTFVTRYFYKLVNRFNGLLSKYGPCLRHLPISWRCGLINHDIVAFAVWLRKTMQERTCNLVLAIDVRSLATLYWCTKTPIVYMDMELLGWEMDTWCFPHKFLLKTIQCDLLRRVVLVLITSPARGDIFADINNYSRKKILTLPTVPRRGFPDPGTDFFRKKFTLPADTRIVLHAGHIVPWTMIHEVIKTVPRWPKNCAMVVHTWSEDTVPEDYLTQLREIARGLPVYFSFEPIAGDQVCNVWASADVGLAFYQDIDSNFTEILFSSNKFGEYMRAGLPVICSNHPSLADFVAEHGVGQAVEPARTDEALRVIMQDYNGYKMRVKNCCEKFFVLEDYVDKIIGEIQSLVSQDTCASKKG